MKKYLEQLKQVSPKLWGTVLATGLIGGSAMMVTPQNDLSPKQETKISQKVAPTQSQRDNRFQPHRTCCTTSNAMFLDFYVKLLPGRAEQKVLDDDYLTSVMKRGDTTDHSVQTRSLKAWGLDTVWRTNANRVLVKQITTEGLPVVVNILHRGRVGLNGVGVLRGGHCVVLRNYDPVKKVFEVADPYGALASNYAQGSVEAGNYTMSESEFFTRWQGGYRTLSAAQTTEFNLNRQ